MADTSGQADIRGIFVDKVAKGYADEDIIFRKYVKGAKTSAREIQWFQRTEGYLAIPTTSGITAVDDFVQSDELARPSVAEQSWTKNTSYVKKWILDSPMISMEDLKDSNVDLLRENIKGITRRVKYQIDSRIINVVTENHTPSTINTAAAVGTGWDDTTDGNPLLDIRAGKTKIRQAGYNPEGAICAMNSIEYEHLRSYLIRNGSDYPSVSVDAVKTGVVTMIEGCKIVVSENKITDSVLLFTDKVSATWMSFTPITATTISEPGIGTKIRVWEEGECLLTDPKSVHLITDTIT